MIVNLTPQGCSVTSFVVCFWTWDMLKVIGVLLISMIGFDFRNQNLIDFEVILIGAERNKDAQLKYMQKFQMPWYAVDSQSQENQKVRQSVRKMLNLEFVPLPSLIILDKDGKILSATGKRDVVELGNNAISAWKELAKQG